MAHRLTIIHLHLVFAVKNRQPLVAEAMREDLQRYMGGIYKMRKHGLLTHYAMPDHYHALIRLHPTDAVMNLIKEIKTSSTKWLNTHMGLQGAFSWQIGYGAFGHSADDIERISRYIETQPDHHSRITLDEEVVMINKRYRADWQLD